MEVPLVIPAIIGDGTLCDYWGQKAVAISSKTPWPSETTFAEVDNIPQRKEYKSRRPKTIKVPKEPKKPKVPKKTKDNILKSRKIKLHPNRSQRTRLGEFADGARFVYNKCIEWRNREKFLEDKMHRYIIAEFVKHHETEEVVEDAIREFNSMIFHNVTHGKSDQKKWKDSESYQFFYTHTNSERCFDREESTRTFVELYEDVDAVVGEFTNLVFSNSIVRYETMARIEKNAIAKGSSPEEIAEKVSKARLKHPIWKTSESYRLFSSYIQKEGNDDLEVRFKKLFATAKPQGKPLNPFFVENPWLLRIASETREDATSDASAAMRSAYSNFTAGNIKKYCFDYRTKKDQETEGYTIGVGNQVTFVGGKLNFLPKFFGDRGFKYFEKPPMTGILPCRCKVSKDAFGDFWLIIPFYVKKTTKQSEKIVSIDPGVSNPWACYPAADGKCFVRGKTMSERIKVVDDEISRIDMRIFATPRNERRELLLQRLRLFRRRKRVRDDCHWKIINDFTKEFGTVLLPHLRTRELSGGLRAKTNRKMFGISHYTFLVRMKFKCSERNVDFFQVSEHQTTVACGRCGCKRNMTLGDREYECECGIKCPRDFQAARNIYILWAVSRKE
jgi:putative transposase